MSYSINLDLIREKFKFDSSLRHNPKMNIEILPYNTKFKDSQYNFREVVGEFIRLVGHKKLPEVINTDDLISKVIEKIDYDNVNQRSEFKQMVKTFFIDDQGQLYLFHPQTLYYINTIDNENKKLALFLRDVLWKQNEPWTVEETEGNSMDLVSDLLFKSLPELEIATKTSKYYKDMVPGISDLFASDFRWLATKSELFTLQIDKLISYYYFFYITQFALRNEMMFNRSDKKVIPVYFTFEEEEKLSKTRVSYEFGWKNVERPVNRLFSHVNLLKMLNISSDENNEFLTYQQIAERINDMSKDEQKILEQDVDTLITEYQNKLSGDSRWALLGKFSNPYQISVLNKLYLLLQMIDHQFNQTSRSKPYNEYKQWFVHFCQKSFLKSRGRSGKMLILDTDYLLFLTKLIIKNEPKIRLKKLFEEFGLRGIVFDRDTQTAIIEYFEKLNLLEKKSDSGDAIYVKTFL